MERCRALTLMSERLLRPVVTEPAPPSASAGWIYPASAGLGRGTLIDLYA